MSLMIGLINCSMKEEDKSKVILNEDSQLIDVGLQAMMSKGPAATRKFIVLKNTNETFLIIGPQFVNSSDREWYEHKDLRQYALFLLDKRSESPYQIHGGGELVFNYSDAFKMWTANFKGASMTYGVYDPSILHHVEQIADWVGRETFFHWSATLRPRPLRVAPNR